MQNLIYLLNLRRGSVKTLSCQEYYCCFAWFCIQSMTRPGRTNIGAEGKIRARVSQMYEIKIKIVVLLKLFFFKSTLKALPFLLLYVKNRFFTVLKFNSTILSTERMISFIYRTIYFYETIAYIE